MSFGSDHTGMGGTSDSEEALRGLKASSYMAGHAAPPSRGGSREAHNVSMLDVSGMVSRTLGLPADSADVMRFAGELHGTINNDPVLRQAVLTGGGIQSFILGRVPPDIADKLDPARRAEAERQRQLQTANRTGSEYAAAFGQSGKGMSGAQGREARANTDGSGTNRSPAEAAGKGSGRPDYGAMNYGTAESLRGVTSGNFNSTPFARQAGMDFPTFDYVRKQDKAFTGANILHAANDAKALGFSPRDKEAMLDHTNIDHYSRDPRHANQALLNYQRMQRQDEELHGWRQQLGQETDPEKRQELEAKIQARTNQYRSTSGVQGHIQTDHPKASKAMKSRAGAVDLQVGKEQSHDARIRHGADAPDAPRNFDKSDLRAGLSDSERQQVAAAARAQGAASAARSESAMAGSRRSSWGDDDAPAAAPPSQSAKADLPNEPNKPAIVIRTAAKDDPTSPNAVSPKPVAAKDDKGATGAKTNEPAKPAPEPPKKLAGAAAGPSVC